ncbi:MAG: carbamoyl phosphate synthase large subunit [Rhodospirillaceae bacterium]|nr:carbamoyl phosphate synthase large subunit [Rhodospirillaceae bacterium]
MPKRNDIKSIFILGAGPIIIGQACEFDYSGSQACKILKKEGYRIILVNSNPATIMTDPDLAHSTYIEPITVEVAEKIIKIEKPDALLPTMGGQTALNTALELASKGILKKYDIELIGANYEAILKAEDRNSFKNAMKKIGLESPKSSIARSESQAIKALESIGLPSVIRPSLTLGGTGGGIAYNTDEFKVIAAKGLEASPISEILIEESVIGWKEYEMEVVRDRNDNAIIICSIENIDPMGIHTGDSVTVAPALTLTDKEFQVMRNASINCMREIGVETGGSNVQFAVNPENGKMLIIEMNPRVSRSSALASKATGFPIAKIAAQLAVGYTLDELINDITETTPASFEPTIDYIVTKIPRFTFDKFSGSEPLLTTSMKSVGETMALGRNFKESLQKALQSLEIGLTGLNNIKCDEFNGTNLDVILNWLAEPSPERILRIAEAFRQKVPLEKIVKATKFDPWFLEQISEIISLENELIKSGIPSNYEDFFKYKTNGFTDARIAELTNSSEETIRKHRSDLFLKPCFKTIDTCAGEFEAKTPYLYSTYETTSLNSDGPSNCEANPTNNNKIIILGGGPNRIGQGIEFDYCCVHACYALAEIGFETIMINCNPETVSTDYDTSHRLYFEPLNTENVIEIVKKEKQNGNLKGVIVQLGGQTPLKLAKDLQEYGINILGTSSDAIDIAEDRDRFQKLLKELKLKQPKNGIAFSSDEACSIAKKIKFPVVIRPSYVLGGQAMNIVHDEEELLNFYSKATKVSGKNPVLIDKYIEDAIEVDVDSISDGDDVFVAGIMQHIEEAGIHSGDSACSLPPFSLDATTTKEIKRQTKILARKLNVIGLMNIQFAIKEDEIFILEVNPRASRTVPFVAKSTGVPIAKIASKVIAGKKLKEFNLAHIPLNYTSVKEAVFPFNKFPGVDTILGPEMKSTGEVMGIDKDFEGAFAKSQIAAGISLPISGSVFISVKDRDKKSVIEPAKKLVDLGFHIIATKGTSEFLLSHGISLTTINKVKEGRPHIVDLIKDGKIQLIFNTTEGKQAISDSYALRREALNQRIPYYTTISGGIAATKAIERIKTGNLEVYPIQKYFKI